MREALMVLLMVSSSQMLDSGSEGQEMGEYTQESMELNLDSTYSRSILDHIANFGVAIDQSISCDRNILRNRPHDYNTRSR